MAKKPGLATAGLLELEGLRNYRLVRLRQCALRELGRQVQSICIPTMELPQQIFNARDNVGQTVYTRCRPLCLGDCVRSAHELISSTRG